MKNKAFRCVEIAVVIAILLWAWLIFYSNNWGRIVEKNESSDIIEWQKYPVEYMPLTNYNLSNFDENVIYRFNIPHEESVRIDFDLDSNFIFYYKSKWWNFEYHYKTGIYLKKYLDDRYDHKTEKNTWTDESIIEEYSIMYKKLSDDKLFELIDDKDIYRITSIDHGMEIDRGFEDYILNDTSEDITVLMEKLWWLSLRWDESQIIEPHTERVRLRPWEIMYVKWSETAYIE